MKLINAISDSPNQNMVVAVDGGGRVVLDLAYKSDQQGWFMTMTWGTMVIRNRRITTGPNILRAFRNILPFGFACVTTDGHEPVNIDDFATGRTTFFILNPEDQAYAEEVIAAHAD